MWGALTFLALFLVIDPTARAAILSAMDEVRIYVAVEAPLSYFVLVILGGSALVSALIMKFWPCVENRPRRVQVMHRYQGQAGCDLARMPRTPTFGLHQIIERMHLERMHLVLPVRARMNCLKLLRSLGAFAGFKRLTGA